MKLTAKYNGVLPILSGAIDIMDPSYDREESNGLIAGLKVKSGEYVTHSVYSDDFHGYGRRTVALRAAHRDYIFNIDTHSQWEEVGYAAVDSGLMSMSEAPKPDFDDNRWQRFCTIVDGPQKRLGTIKKMCGKPILVSTSGIGDGCYPVYCLRNQAQEIIAVEVRFTEHLLLFTDFDW